MSEKPDVIGYNLHEGKGIECVVCYSNVLSKSEFPYLIAAIHKPLKINGSLICPTCNKPYLRDETVSALKYVKSFL